MTEQYTREKLIELAERAVVPHEQWRNRDSSDAQMQAGQARALLLAGCEFEVLTKGEVATNDWTIWIEVSYTGFDSFEGGDMDTNYFYLPTEKRLTDNEGKDWY